MNMAYCSNQFWCPYKDTKEVEKQSHKPGPCVSRCAEAHIHPSKQSLSLVQVPARIFQESN